jgi:hypothetical protein
MMVEWRPKHVRANKWEKKGILPVHFLVSSLKTSFEDNICSSYEILQWMHLELLVSGKISLLQFFFFLTQNYPSNIFPDQNTEQRRCKHIGYLSKRPTNSCLLVVQTVWETVIQREWQTSQLKCLTVNWSQAVNSSSLHVVLQQNAFWSVASRLLCQKLGKTTSSKLQIRWILHPPAEAHTSRHFLPSYPPATSPTISRLTLIFFFFFYFYPFYKSEPVALEKWVWKFEMRHHYVVKFLVLF